MLDSWLSPLLSVPNLPFGLQEWSSLHLYVALYSLPIKPSKALQPAMTRLRYCKENKKMYSGKKYFLKIKDIDLKNFKVGKKKMKE